MIDLKLFSSDMKEKLRSADVYIYDQIPVPLRVQVFNVFRSQIGSEVSYRTVRTVAFSYQWIVDKLCDEYGIHNLYSKPYTNQRDYFKELTAFLTSVTDVHQFLDVIQTGCTLIEAYTADYNYIGQANARSMAERAVETINRRMKENSFGYQYADEKIIRIDSYYMHAEAVVPALTLLNRSGFDGPQEEFLAAHEHLRHGRGKEAMNEALKAFESTMKAICIKRGWTFGPKDTAAPLVKVCVDNGLIPEYALSKFTGLRTLLVDGAPTVRNRTSGHGQGAAVLNVPEHIVAYCLHMTAAGIVFLCEAEALLS